ncbi:DUF397 domain-containing protein [Streptomyces sp. NBC_00299]|uniref:DUF397 domain-containing protein n=1 Tax=Streptomyces sp. NBC_00299 TaxID=2975705 RepID=UPI002E2C7344|nr:DUF397 domain-containing protein [Streptomyces sp. NBC_00299]
MKWLASLRFGPTPCAEVGETHAVVAVRASKNAAGPILTFEPAAFSTFLGCATAAE